VDDVATLLGHANPSITLKHYSRWVKARQDRLDNIVKEAWDEGDTRAKKKAPAPVKTGI
jgi:hypothetical protein